MITLFLIIILGMIPLLDSFSNIRLYSSLYLRPSCQRAGRTVAISSPLPRPLPSPLPSPEHRASTYTPLTIEGPAGKRVKLIVSSHEHGILSELKSWKQREYFSLERLKELCDLPGVFRLNNRYLNQLVQATEMRFLKQKRHRYKIRSPSPLYVNEGTDR